MRFSATLTSLFASTVLAITTPPSGAIVVGKSSAAKYKTVKAAVTAAASGAIIFIEAGTYPEQVYIPAGKNNLKIIGYSAADTSYEGNKVIITQGLAQDAASKPNNDKTATLRAWGDGLKLYNVNLVNSRGQGSQALALSANGDQLGFYACQFSGFQDTVMSTKGRHFIGKSLISGATDYIFGQYGVLWIQNSVLECVKANVGYITGKSPPSFAWFFLFLFFFFFSKGIVVSVWIASANLGNNSKRTCRFLRRILFRHQRLQSHRSLR